MSLTPYGPGKYDLLVDEFVHQLDVDAECGSVQEDGWKGLYLGPFLDECTDLTLFPELTSEDLDFLRAQAGAIAEEDSQGFVSVTYLESKEDLDFLWSALTDQEVEA